MIASRPGQPVSRFVYAGLLLLTGMLLVWVLSPAAPDAVPQVLLETFSRLEYVEQRVRRLEQQLAKCCAARARHRSSGVGRVASVPIEAQKAPQSPELPEAPEGPPVDVNAPVLPWGGGRALEVPGLACERKDLSSFALCLDTSDIKHDLIARTGLHSDCDAVMRLAKKGKQPHGNGVFLDVGSNTGMCSMMLLSAGWKVIGFEPSPRNLFFLTKSALMNPELNRNFTLFPIALGAESGAVPLFTERYNLANSVLGYPTRADPKSHVMVRVAKLDDVLWPQLIVGEHSHPPPVIVGMKMDVRGFEVNVLRGASRLLAAKAIKSMAVAVATEWLRNAKSSPSELCNELIQAGFDLFEDKCAGEGVTIVEKGTVIDVARCRHWDEANADCSINAKLRGAKDD